MYDKGNGVPEDPAQAVAWYQKASATDVESKLLLSRLMDIGRGTPVNKAYSTALLRQAAVGGHLAAELALANRLETGTGVKKDEAEAALWYRSAAEKGDAVAQEKLQWAIDGYQAMREEDSIELDVLQSYVGRYRKASVVIEGTNLFVQFDDQPRRRLRAISSSYFLIDGRDGMRLRFVVEHNRVVAMERIFSDGYRSLDVKQ